MNYLRLTAIVGIIAAIQSAPAQGLSQSAQVKVAFITCASESSEPPVLRVYDLIALKDVSATPLETSEQRGVRIATISLPSGYYEFSVGRLPCTATRQLAVLPGVNRSVVLKGEAVFYLTQGLASIAGTVANNDLIVTADCWDDLRKEIKYLAEIENGAFYFDRIQAPVLCDINVAIRGRSDINIFSLPKIAISNLHRKSLNVINLDWNTLLR